MNGNGVFSRDNPLSLILRILARSIFRQGILSSYRKAYWKPLVQILTGWYGNPLKLTMGITILLSGQHFINYAKEVAAGFDDGIRRLAASRSPPACAAELGISPSHRRASGR
jgi:hypothetical protein